VRADARLARRTLDALRKAQGPASVWEVARIAQLSDRQTGITLARLANRGHATRTRRGTYTTGRNP
jgi:predicted transcriptional regulator of viral defense system